MPATSPEQLDRLLSEAMNRGDIDAVMSLYEPDAAMKPQPGQVALGSSAIRDTMRAFIAMKPTLTLEARTLAQTEKIALTTSKWELTGTGADGQPVQMRGKSVEVARRQEDGTWRFAIDTPWGLEWEE